MATLPESSSMQTHNNTSINVSLDTRHSTLLSGCLPLSVMHYQQTKAGVVLVVHDLCSTAVSSSSTAGNPKYMGRIFFYSDLLAVDPDPSIASKGTYTYKYLLLLWRVVVNRSYGAYKNLYITSFNSYHLVLLTMAPCSTGMFFDDKRTDFVWVLPARVRSFFVRAVVFVVVAAVVVAVVDQCIQARSRAWVSQEGTWSCQGVCDYGTRT